jgi:hypothetical protein
MIRRNDDPPGGCATIVLFGIGLVLLVWAIKIGLVVLGWLLIVGGVVGAVLGPAVVWYRISRRPAAQAAMDELDTALAALSAESARRLSTAIHRWDDLQNNRGVGTRRETADFADTADDTTHRFFSQVSSAVERGEDMPSQDGGAGRETGSRSRTQSHRTWRRCTARCSHRRFPGHMVGRARKRSTSAAR